MLLWQIRNFGKFYSNSTVNSHQQIQLNGKTVCNFWKGMKQTVETIESLKRALRTPYMLSSILNNSSEKAIKCLSSVVYNSYAAFIATSGTLDGNLFVNCTYVERRNFKVWKFWGFTHGKLQSWLGIWEKSSLVIYSKVFTPQKWNIVRL